MGCTRTNLDPLIILNGVIHTVERNMETGPFQAVTLYHTIERLAIRIDII